MHRHDAAHGLHDVLDAGAGGTIAGVKTNLDFQVLREDGSVINGLYAGGETSNREMYAYAYSSGSGVGYALASGRQIGMNLMK